ncbi:MAG: hypothetical protein U0992_17400 [Planctomycetaceae bacterium]
MSIGQQQKQHLDVQIRWLIRRDMPEVLKIERESFEFPWTDEDFMCCLRQRNCIGMVAEYDHQIVGFMVYELHKSRLHILNFAVGSEFREWASGRRWSCGWWTSVAAAAAGDRAGSPRTEPRRTAVLQVARFPGDHRAAAALR